VCEENLHNSPFLNNYFKVLEVWNLKVLRDFQKFISGWESFNEN
jgi:hypothetical protein